MCFFHYHYCFLLSACGPSCNRTCDRTSHGHSALIAPFVFKKVFVSKTLLLSNTLYWTWFWIPVTLAVCGRMTQPLVSVCVYICVCLPARDIKLFNNCWCTGVFFVPAHYNNCKRIPSNVTEKMAEWKNAVGQSNLHKFTCRTYNDRLSLESNVLSINRSKISLIRKHVRLDDMNVLIITSYLFMPSSSGRPFCLPLHALCNTHHALHVLQLLYNRH